MDWNQRVADEVIRDADRDALNAAADRLIPMIAARAPVMVAKYPSGNRYGPPGFLKASIDKSDVKLSPLGTFIEVGSEWYGIFPMKARQVKHKNPFIYDALDESQALI